jgi:hypothetical protein
MVVEIIIISLVIIMVSLAITQVISSSVRGVDQTMSQQPAVYLSRETTEVLRAVAMEDWHNISDLATGTASLYYPAITGGKWVATTGTEAVSLNNATYTRSFYLTDVYRATSTGDVTSTGGYWDPSTVKVNSQVTWTDTWGAAESFLQAEYLSRFLNQTYPQTDWSGGAVGEVVTTATTTTFATSDNLDFSGAPGSVQLNAQ